MKDIFHYDSKWFKIETKIYLIYSLILKKINLKYLEFN